jgi:hypothetical protein
MRVAVSILLKKHSCTTVDHEPGAANHVRCTNRDWVLLLAKQHKRHAIGKASHHAPTSTAAAAV